MSGEPVVQPLLSDAIEPSLGRDGDEREPGRAGARVGDGDLRRHRHQLVVRRPEDGRRRGAVDGWRRRVREALHRPAEDVEVRVQAARAGGEARVGCVVSIFVCDHALPCWSGVAVARRSEDPACAAFPFRVSPATLEKSG